MLDTICDLCSPHCIFPLVSLPVKSRFTYRCFRSHPKQIVKSNIILIIWAALLRVWYTAALSCCGEATDCDCGRSYLLSGGDNRRRLHGRERITTAERWASHRWDLQHGSWSSRPGITLHYSSSSWRHAQTAHWNTHRILRCRYTSNSLWRLLLPREVY